MNYYLINLDRDHERWTNIQDVFALSLDRLIRVPGVDVVENPESVEEDFCDRKRFQRLMNRDVRNGEIGCYASHLKALRFFLESGEEYAVIGEDDLLPKYNSDEIIENALQFSKHWDLLRLVRCRTRNFVPMCELQPGVELGWNIKGFTYTAAYMVNRRAARFILEHFLPMFLPIDVMLFAGWEEMKEMSILPNVFDFSDAPGASTIGNRKQPWNGFLRKNWLSSQMFKFQSRKRRYEIQKRRIEAWKAQTKGNKDL